MKVYQYDETKDWAAILQRPMMNVQELDNVVQAVLDEVKQNGDEALKAYTARFDQVELNHLAATEEEIKAAADQLSDPLKQSIQVAYRNIHRFHKAQQQQVTIVETMPGVRCWRKSVGIEKVGLYIPGGTAPLFSTILMLGVPAKLAGCREIVLCTPPQKDGSLHPAILYTAQLVGITQIFKVGGAQAVAGMAYGTESIPSVYKIFGPGNQYVTAAKQLVNKQGTAIDMPAGPSEVLVCADESAEPSFVAADLLSQAEHGVDSQVVLIAFSEDFVHAVQEEIEQQVKQLPRQAIAEQALVNSVSIVVDSRVDALSLINIYAPEHLIVAVKEVEEFVQGIINAGSVFMGNYTPESVGDYASGTNHTLPTNGFATAYSGVSLDSFVKKITFQQLSHDGLVNIGSAVEEMARAEQLEAHRNAVSIRLAHEK